MSLIKYKKRILIFGLAVSLLMPFSLALAEEKKESFEELSIKLRALQVAGQVEEYLKNNPDLTIKELQVDLVFKRIAVQRVGETGYTAIVDVNSGYFYFHPQEALVNTDTHALKGNLSNWWEIIRQTIGDQCRESSGLYNWQEDDGSVTEKYMYLACVDGATADGKNLFVGATAYLDEYKEIGKTAVENKGTQVLMAREGLLNNAKNVAEKIELVVNGFSRDIRSLSQTIGIRNLLSQVQQEGILTNTETEKKFYPADKELYWQNVYEYFSRFYSQNMDEIDAVRLFDKNGYIVCGSVLGEEDVNDYKGDKSWFRDVMNPAIVKNNEVYVSPINIANRTNSPALRYIVPIEMNGERLGLVIINFKANAVYSDFNKENNIFFLDKAYENSEGEITTDWVVVLADSRNPSQTLDESRSAASLIGPDQIASNSGYLEFLEEGREWAGAYQKVNVLGREWYVVSVLEKDLLKTEPQTESEKEIDLAVVIYWLFGGLAAVFLILFIFHRFGITTIEKNTIFYLLGAALLIIIVLFIFSTWQITQSMKNETKRAATEALEAVAVSRAEHVNT
ncbi:cache domain-containing protein, partial [Candidatus Parcubacteria bacterium]|nr:cache domain-containing protein [Candidatus Parcubacteria bacterium]